MRTARGFVNHPGVRLKVTEADLRALAEALARYDFKTFANKEIGAAKDWRVKVSLAFGEHGGFAYYGDPGAALAASTDTVEGRCMGILAAIETARKNTKYDGPTKSWRELGR